MLTLLMTVYQMMKSTTPTTRSRQSRDEGADAPADGAAALAAVIAATAGISHLMADAADRARGVVVPLRVREHAEHAEQIIFSSLSQANDQLRSAWLRLEDRKTPTTRLYIGWASFRCLHYDMLLAE